jgi:hypothetical protein
VRSPATPAGDSGLHSGNRRHHCAQGLEAIPRRWDLIIGELGSSDGLEAGGRRHGLQGTLPRVHLQRHREGEWVHEVHPQLKGKRRGRGKLWWRRIQQRRRRPILDRRWGRGSPPVNFSLWELERDRRNLLPVGLSFGDPLSRRARSVRSDGRG